jgi:hypothetical protein
MQREQYAATFGQEAALIQRQQAERAGLSVEEAAQRLNAEAAAYRDQQYRQATAPQAGSYATVATPSPGVLPAHPTREQARISRARQLEDERRREEEGAKEPQQLRPTPRPPSAPRPRRVFRKETFNNGAPGWVYAVGLTIGLVVWLVPVVAHYL